MAATELYFVTSNANKFREFQAQIPGLQQLQLDLDEIQSLNPQAVIAHKLAQAARQHDGQFVVEDTSLSLDALGGLPGTYVKSFQEALGLAGIGALALKYPHQAATARTVIGYRDTAGESHYFTGEVRGSIVMPRDAGGFGWDDIFVPEGFDQTFSELGPDKKAAMSMRRRAIDQFKTFLMSLSQTPAK